MNMILNYIIYYILNYIAEVDSTDPEFILMKPSPARFCSHLFSIGFFSFLENKNKIFVKESVMFFVCLLPTK